MGEPFLRILTRWWWVPASMLAVSIAAGLWWTSRQPPVYRASAMLAVIPNSSVQGDADVLRSLDALERRTLLATFARLPGTRQSRGAVAAAVQRDPRDLDAYQIGASVLPNTNIIRIDVDGPDPGLAARMANAAGEVAAADARALYRIYTMRPIADAEPAAAPIHPDPRRNSLAAGVAGLFIGTVAVGLIAVRRRGPALHDETTTFSQDGTFKLLSHRLVQHGPSFPRRLDMRIDAARRQATVRYTDDEGEEQVESEDLESPADLANGLILTLLKNISPDATPLTLPMLVAAPKPRVVDLEITAAGEEPFSTPGASRKAVHYVVKVEIGGIAGLFAPLLGKQPPDSHVWILGGEAPAFVKSEQPLYAGGPVWRIELVSPVWPDQPRKDSR